MSSVAMDTHLDGEVLVPEYLFLFAVDRVSEGRMEGRHRGELVAQESIAVFWSSYCLSAGLTGMSLTHSEAQSVVGVA